MNRPRTVYKRGNSHFVLIWPMNRSSFFNFLILIDLIKFNHWFVRFCGLSQFCNSSCRLRFNGLIFLNQLVTSSQPNKGGNGRSHGGLGRFWVWTALLRASLTHLTSLDFCNKAYCCEFNWATFRPTFGPIRPWALSSKAALTRGAAHASTCLGIPHLRALWSSHVCLCTLTTLSRSESSATPRIASLELISGSILFFFSLKKFFFLWERSTEPCRVLN